MTNDDDLQAWLDEQDAVVEAERKERERLAKAAVRPFEHMKFDFMRHLYAKAIGVAN